jgi:hypothetical protein
VIADQTVLCSPYAPCQLGIESSSIAWDWDNDLINAVTSHHVQGRDQFHVTDFTRVPCRPLQTDRGEFISCESGPTFSETNR